MSDFQLGASGMKKGGSAKKKKQGYKDRKDESIAMRIRKKRLRNNLELLLMNLMVSLVLKQKNLVKLIDNEICSYDRN